ncbi:MAG: 2-oxo acid dehydrogenase subunit E2, partial [Rhizobiaceae bacterium]|nr:2-oxo acid dehydrogenase subunit E2 [Rhizobiaceae bacterium]
MGTISIKLPDVGEGVTEAELVEWHVKVGDFVREDDILADVMTDKATVEIPSICDGTVTWVGGEVGDTLAVGTKIVRIESLEAPDAETLKEQPPEPVSAEPEKKEQKPPADDNEKPLAAPAVRLRAQEAGIDLKAISGTGPDGHIIHADLDKILTGRGTGSKDSKPQLDASIREIKITGLRRKIADRMATANSHIPHITIIEEVDVTEIESLRAKLNDENPERTKLTLLPFILSALSKAVREYPQMNATFDDDAEVVKQFGGVHAGIATMT